MANFYGTARSNYFKVKDAEAFKAWVEGLDLQLITNADGLFGFYSTDGDTGCFPDIYDPEDENQEDPISIVDEVAEHLADGEVCVLMEAGAEKCRYISGWAVAFDNTGKEVRVSLNDIYAKAKEAFGVEPTDASY